MSTGQPFSFGSDPAPTCPYAVHLAILALGSRDDGAGVDIEDHLRECPSCRAELARLRELPRLLAVTREVGAAPTRQHEVPAPHLLDRLFDAIDVERRQRRRRRIGLSAAAAVVAGAAAAGVAVAAWPAAPPPPPSLAGSSNLGVAAEATVAARPWGSQIEMTLRGLTPGATCRLLARARDGRVETAASWRVTYQRSLRVEGMTSVPSAELTELQVVDDHDRRLVTVAVPPAEGKNR
ncbi:hypothetical protein [Actinopolymorpha pittospori]